jgi:hypothetical protein
VTPTPIELRWAEGERDVRWTRGETQAGTTFPAPPYTVTSWPDPPSIVVVEADPRVDNAVVLNLDGTERLRLVPPQDSTGFYAVYPGSTGLIAVFTTSTGDRWGTPDLTTGTLSDVTLWR